MSNSNHPIQTISTETGQFLQEAGQKTTEKVLEKTEQYSDAYTAMHQIIHNFYERVPYIIIGIIVFFIFWLLAQVFKFFVKKALLKRANSRKNLVLVLNRVGSTFILFFGFLIALVIIIPGFSPAQLIGALGIGSVAIGFAFKDIFQNLLSGILILLSEPFRIGDAIIIDNLEGIVEDIQIRATTLRSYDGRRIVIPNATMYTSPITVNTAYKYRRCEFIVGIGYSDDITKATEIIMQVLKFHPKVLEEPEYTVQVSAFADFSVNLMVRWWINLDKTYIAASISEIQTEVKKAFDKEGVSIPFPIRDVNIANLPVSTISKDSSKQSG